MLFIEFNSAKRVRIVTPMKYYNVCMVCARKVLDCLDLDLDLVLP